MTANEIKWIMQTIEDRETAMRFVQAQYEVGRISGHVLRELAREYGWTDCPQFKSSRPREQVTTPSLLFEVLS
jgi:hypothetical protein